MDEKKSENINKTPEKMSRIAWPKAKYGKRGVTDAVDTFTKTNMLLKEQFGQTQYLIKV